ncbi:MAG: Hsp70 family protein [Candidatus Sumerlaeaceae bacterium]
MIHVGIDLGTTYSKISHVGVTGTPSLFPDATDSSAFQTPSVAFIDSKGCLVGNVVESLLEDNPDLPIVRFVKLKMGTNEPVYYDDKSRPWSPQAVSALILKKLKQDAEAFAYEDVGSAVITVPAQFGHNERRATRDAGLLAGMQVSQIVEEPVAAATFYGICSAQKEQTVFVYDLGGGTFDASILRCTPTGLFVLATEGSRTIGGKWFDEVIMGVAAEEFQRVNGFDPRNDRRAESILRRVAHDAKIKLSMPGKTQVQQTVVLSGKTSEFLLTRSEFERLISVLLNTTVEICTRCLESAKLTWKDIDRVLVVGGSTLVPMVQQRIQRESGKQGDQFVQRQPHQAIAFGAAHLAQTKTGEGHAEAPKLIHQIAPYHLGIRVRDPQTGGARVQVLVPRNAPLPAERKVVFQTSRADQVRMMFEFVQTKGDEGSSLSLGHFAFGPIAAPRMAYPIEVTAAYDEQGIVKITARDESGHEMQRLLAQGDENYTGGFYTNRMLVADSTVNKLEDSFLR